MKEDSCQIQDKWCSVWPPTLLSGGPCEWTVPRSISEVFGRLPKTSEILHLPESGPSWNCYHAANADEKGG